MAESTRSQASLREVEERLESKMSAKIESKMMELAGSIQKSLSDSLKQTMTELLKNNSDGVEDSSRSKAANSGERHDHSHYSCGTRLSRIDFPRFNGDKVNQ
ncbi:hypothetical protein Lal_00028180 [Lupinus albus]|uniref:Uncharacterized protein n=1 Tax=Lupinus albus TaxID=3870 RepID=A0A6A4QKY6_LUPAL|nr:hypothetical protein Lalb_Chr05g0227241 [Lupinus albus]KAF1872272.1 hypothetical protein Lal_00028180 [Lupinus albus]